MHLSASTSRVNCHLGFGYLFTDRTNAVDSIRMLVLFKVLLSCLRKDRKDRTDKPRHKFTPGATRITHGGVSGQTRASGLGRLGIEISLSPIAVVQLLYILGDEEDQGKTPSVPGHWVSALFTMSIYSGITPKGYMVMIMASLGAILFVGHTRAPGFGPYPVELH